MMNLLWFLSGHHHGSHEGASSHGRLALGFGAGPLLCMAHMEGPMDIWVIAGGETFSIEDATEDADGFQLTGIDGRRLCSLTCGPQVPESPCFAGYPLIRKRGGVPARHSASSWHPRPPGRGRSTLVVLNEQNIMGL